jgi:hypothetical protein
MRPNRRTHLILAASVFAWAGTLLCFALLVRADNSSIAIPRVSAEAFDRIPENQAYLVEGHPDIKEITMIGAIDDDDDLIALGRWVRSRMILDLDADPLLADPIRAIDRAAAAPVGRRRRGSLGARRRRRESRLRSVSPSPFAR